MSDGTMPWIPRHPHVERFLVRRSALADEGLVERSIVVCREDRPRLERGIEIWPLEFFLAELWQDRLRAGAPRQLRLIEEEP